MSSSLALIAGGLVAIGYGLWVYLAQSAERFYLSRPYLLATTGWVLTGVMPIGAGACLIGLGSLFPMGSIFGQIFVGAGLIVWLLGFGLILIHPDRIRPRWLRGRVGD